MADEPDTDFLSMTDEDFMAATPSSFGSKPKEEDTPVDENTNDTIKADEVEENADTTDEPAKAEPDSKPKPDDAAKSDTKDENPSDEDIQKGKPPVVKKAEEPAKDDKPKADDKTDPKAQKPVEPTKETDAVPASKDLTQEELAGFYDEVMKPFKANGREIKLRSKAEAIRLMQMGAGYGRKLHDMQPHLKTLKMLENNNLLDEGRLSFLIDLDKKNPDAIKKLIKDSGIDPIDLGVEGNADYRPTNHSVDDNEIRFSEALKEVSSQEGGRETIHLINSKWDKESKDALWAQPEILGIIQSQRENGLYDQIASEIDRKKTLGEISYNTPFLQAYKIAGDALVAANSLILPGNDTTQSASMKTPEASGSSDRKVLGTRVVAPKSQASNGDKAKAAAPSVASPGKAKTVSNPLEMADDDFIKTLNGRL